MIAALETDARRGGFFWADSSGLRRRAKPTRRSENENAAEADLDGVPYSKREEAYFFLPAGFLAFAFEADLATFAVFFFAAIVSTSPDIGMNTVSASIL
jgi:hypothetical protein